MRFTKEGFTDEQFRWCFWGPTGSGGPESDAANAGGFGGGGGGGGGGDGSDRDAGRSGPSAGDPSQNAGNIGVGSGAGLGASSDGRDRGSDPSQNAGNIGVGSGAGLGASSDGRDRGGPTGSNVEGGGSDSRPTTSPAQRGGLYSSALASTSPVSVQSSALNNLMGGPTTSVNGVPVTRRAPVSIDMPNYTPTNYGQSDLDAARAAYGDARAEAYSDKQFGFDFGPFGGPFGMYEGIADALFDPEAATANAIANYGFGTIDGQQVPSSAANYSPTGLDVVTAGGPLSQGGRVAAYNPANNVVFDTSPFSGLNPFGEGVPENIQALYDRANAVAEAEMGRGGDSDPLFVPSGGAGAGEVDEETGEPTEFPPFKQREYTYTPFTSNFYTIPSRFTQPYGLLG